MNRIRRFVQSLKQSPGRAVGCVAAAGATVLVGPVLAVLVLRSIEIRPYRYHPSDVDAFLEISFLGASISLGLAMFGWAAGWAVDRRLRPRQDRGAGEVAGDGGRSDHRLSGFVVGATVGILGLCLLGLFMGFLGMLAD